MARARTSVEFDHVRDATAEPSATLALLREANPVAWSDHHGGFWILTRHEDIARAFRDQAHFSSSRSLLADLTRASTTSRLGLSRRTTPKSWTARSILRTDA